MVEEPDALQQIGTWDVVPLPTRVTPITCNWVYKINTRSDGSIERYKVSCCMWLLAGVWP